MKTETAVLLATNFIEVAILYHLTNFFFDRKIEDIKLVRAALVLRYVITFIVTNYFAYPYLNISVSLMTLFLITAGYRGSKSKKVMVTVMIHILMLLSEMIVLWILKLNGFEFLKKIEYFSSITLILVQIIFFIMSIVVLGFKNMNTVIQKIPKLYLLLIVIFMCCLCGLLLYFFGKNVFYSPIFFLLIPGIVITAFGIIYLYDLLAEFYKQKVILLSEKKRRENQDEELKQVEKDVEEWKRFRHDMKNRMLVIHQFAEQEQNENIKEYTSDMIRKIDDIVKYSETGNYALDHLINYKLSLAQQNRIKTDVTVELPEKIEIAEDDLIVILANLLDNAIEASEKVKEDKFIDLNIKYEKGCIFIHVKNRYEGEIITENGNFITNKKDKKLHGLGLKSVREIIETYNGIMDLKYEENIFSVNILIYVS